MSQRTPIFCRCAPKRRHRLSEPLVAHWSASYGLLRLSYHARSSLRSSLKLRSSGGNSKML